MTGGARGIRVDAVLPSLTRSDMSESMFDDEPLMEAFTRRTALGRVGEPDDIAGPVLFLASEDAGFVTGVNLPVDGGVSASNGQPNFTAYRQRRRRPSPRTRERSVVAFFRHGLVREDAREFMSLAVS